MPRIYQPIARRAKAWASEEAAWQERPTMTVFEPEEAPRDTGLLDANGVRLYASDTREPIGFKVR